MTWQPSKVLLVYKEETGDCRRIRCDDYQIHEGLHKMYLLDHLVGSFPLDYVVMVDEEIE